MVSKRAHYTAVCPHAGGGGTRRHGNTAPSLAFWPDAPPTIQPIQALAKTVLIRVGGINLNSPCASSAWAPPRVWSPAVANGWCAQPQQCPASARTHMQREKGQTAACKTQSRPSSGRRAATAPKRSPPHTQKRHWQSHAPAQCGHVCWLLQATRRGACSLHARLGLRRIWRGALRWGTRACRWVRGVDAGSVDFNIP